MVQTPVLGAWRVTQTDRLTCVASVLRRPLAVRLSAKNMTTTTASVVLHPVVAVLSPVAKPLEQALVKVER